MSAPARPPIPEIIQQHAEEAAILRQIRSLLVRAPHVTLAHLGRLDERIAAHLDGLAEAGPAGLAHTDAAFATPGPGEVFTVAVLAIAARDQVRLDRLFALAEALPEARRGLLSAFGWVAAADLGGTVAPLLDAATPIRRMVGIAACLMHRRDPGRMLTAAIADADPGLRACALRAAGEGGRRDLLPDCRAGLADAASEVRLQAAFAALLLGARAPALAVLAALAMHASDQREDALRLCLLASDQRAGMDLLRDSASAPADRRLLIQGMGLLGDPRHLPWLIELMADPRYARVAGESFALITGLDLAWLDLERDAPADFSAGPSDDPDDPDLGLDPDEDLPWPDPARIETWWAAHRERFAPGLQTGSGPGVRYFMGAPVSVAGCARVLRTGYQRQRHLAALWLCLLRPGTGCLPIAAPAWRQQRWLAT